MRTVSLPRRVVWTALLALTLAGDACSGDASGPATASIAFERTDYSIAAGGSLALELFSYDAKLNPVSDDTPVAWTSSNTSLLTIDADGTAHGLALGGPVTVTAAKGAFTATTSVVVTPLTVSVVSPVEGLAVGQSVQLQTIARDAHGSPIAAPAATQWIISPSTVATVTQSGVVTAIRPGIFSVFASVAGTQGNLQTGVISPFDGTWSGQSAADLGNQRTIRFNVRFGTVVLFVIPDNPTTCGGGQTVAFNLPTSAPINNDVATFTASPTNTLQTVTLSFTSPSTVTGSHTAITVGAVPCTGGGGAPNVTIPANTFSAAKL